MTAKEITTRMRADKCLTPSRSRSKRKHRNYSNKYTKLMGKLGYPGIGKDGYFTKWYSYGCIGHCCIFVQYHFIIAGLGAFVPKGNDFIENTNQYASWLKSEPLIEGYGRVEWTSDPKKAKHGAVCFKGRKKSKKFSHTCTFLKYENGYVYTVDGNISGTYKGKKVNNGLVKKRKARKFRWGFANMPYPAWNGKPIEYKPGHVYTLQHKMNVRLEHNTKSRILGTMPRGHEIAPLKVYKTGNGSVWLRIPYKSKYVAWVCARTPKNLHIK